MIIGKRPLLTLVYAKQNKSMKQNIIKEKSFLFALDVIKIYKFLSLEKKEFVLSKQMLRSGTSVGANVREAEHAQSKADFMHNLSIALKEANETEYWLELLYQSEYLTTSQYQDINCKIVEQLRLLTSILNTSKSN